MQLEKVFNVSEFNEFINLYLGGVGNITVEGEISSINISQNKWIFITIKDEKSSVEVFGMTFKIHGFNLLEEGMKVHVYGIPRLYEKSGRFSISAESIIPAGEGALKLAFEKLKQKLDKEGLFRPERKRPLPRFPERIGLITAKGSRAYSDFVKVLQHRMSGIKIYFYPVNVQGKDSVESILRAFDFFNNSSLPVDLLVLTRGGGSLEDLQSFNDERLARAVFSSRVPVVCGVGHEEDVSIADLVSDVRASTPSNAAELIVASKSEVVKEVNFYVNIIEKRVKELLNDKNRLVFYSIGILKDVLTQRLVLLHLTINNFRNQFKVFEKNFNIMENRIMNVKEILSKDIAFLIKENNSRLMSITRLMKSLNPKEVLKRGFSVTMDTNGKIIKSVSETKKGDVITSNLYDGKINSEII